MHNRWSRRSGVRPDLPHSTPWSVAPAGRGPRSCPGRRTSRPEDSRPGASRGRPDSSLSSRSRSGWTHHSSCRPCPCSRCPSSSCSSSCPACSTCCRTLRCHSRTSRSGRGSGRRSGTSPDSTSSRSGRGLRCSSSSRGRRPREHTPPRPEDRAGTSRSCTAGPGRSRSYRTGARLGRRRTGSSAGTRRPRGRSPEQGSSCTVVDVRPDTSRPTRWASAAFSSPD